MDISVLQLPFQIILIVFTLLLVWDRGVILNDALRVLDSHIGLLEALEDGAKKGLSAKEVLEKYESSSQD